MNPPPTSSSNVLAVYVVSFALAIAAVVLDIRHGGVLFAFLGLVGSLAMTTVMVYRMARAMAFSPMADRLASAPARVPSSRERPAA